MDRRLLIFLGVGLVVALIVAGVVSGFASGEPDGLERVAIDKGFEEAAADHSLGDFPLADYAMRGVENERVSTALAGIIGVAITLAVSGVLFYGIHLYGKARHRKEAA